MTDITTVTGSNGTGNNPANGQATDVNDVQVQDPKAVLAKNKELLAQIKKYQQSTSDLAQKLQEIEQGKLQAEGKKDEVITQLQAQLKQKDSELKTKTAKFAFKSVKDQTALKAKELGCIDTDLLLKAMDLDSLQVNVVDEDSFNVDMESLTGQLEQVRKTKPFLFKQAGPIIKDGVPGQTQMQSTEADFSKMSLEDLRKSAQNLSKK